MKGEPQMQENASEPRLRVGGGLALRGVVGPPPGRVRAAAVLAAVFAFLAGGGAGYWLGNGSRIGGDPDQLVSRARLRALLQRIDDAEKLREALYGIVDPATARPTDGVAPVPWERGDGR